MGHCIRNGVCISCGCSEGAINKFNWECSNKIKAISSEEKEGTYENAQPESFEPYCFNCKLKITFGFFGSGGFRCSSGCHFYTCSNCHIFFGKKCEYCKKKCVRL